MKRATYFVAIAILAMSTSFALARGRGGSGHAGGGHAAVHSSGHAGGNYGHGYGGRGYYGGGGYYGRGYYGGYGGFGLGYGLGYGFGWGYPSYGYGYGNYGYPYGSSDGYYAPNAYPGYGNYYGSAPALPSSQMTAAAAPVRLDVIVPDAQAQVWLNGQLIQGTGTERDFVSSPVETGYNYTYKLRAAWKENGQPVNVERDVQVTPGITTFVDFSQRLVGDSANSD